jgi:hypothetical protein
MSKVLYRDFKTLSALKKSIDIHQRLERKAHFIKHTEILERERTMYNKFLKELDPYADSR